jgi:hypothetical protein
MNFNIELNGRLEELTNEQRSALMGLLASADVGSNGATIEEVGEPEYPDTSMLTEHEQAIVEAVRDDPGNQKGHYHQMLLDDDRTPYNDRNDENYNERGDLGHRMWELNVSEGGEHLVNSGRLWYPV